MIYNFLFPQYCRERIISFLILAVRVFFGILFFIHGVDKMMNFSILSDTYPSVFGLGSYMTLMLAIFTEFCCSLFLIFGLMIRVILIPMIISMAVAFFFFLYGKNAIRIMKRDHANHLSPNCAWSESAAAGAMHIQLGGTHTYFGKVVEKPTIGDDDRPVEKQDILRANRLLYISSTLMAGIAALAGVMIWLI